MPPLEYLPLLLSAAVYCASAAPASIQQLPGHCSGIPRIDGRETVGVWDQDHYPPGTTVHYKCRPGFKLIGTIRYVCAEGNWEPLGQQAQCEKIYCGYPGDIPFGTFKLKNGNDFVFGAVAEYSCDRGSWFISRHKTRECTEAGWSNELPRCGGGKCSKPEIENGYVRRLYYYDELSGRYPPAFYFCDDGFATPDKTLRSISRCTNNGWTPEPKCVKTCQLPSVRNANLAVQDSNIYIQGDTLKFQCFDGYETINGKSSGQLECLSDGRFTTNECYKVCRLPQLSNGVFKFKGGSVQVGRTVVYECNEKSFSENGGPYGKSECTSNGWNPLPKCRETSCLIKHNLGEKSFDVGSTVHLKCPRGMELVGANYIQCYSYGWGPEVPICRDRQGKEFRPEINADPPAGSICPTASDPPNAEIKTLKKEYGNGDAIEIVCSERYLLFGSGKVLCKDAKWQSAPRCVEKVKCGQPPSIGNGAIVLASLKAEYHTGSAVQYECQEGYQIAGSDQSVCMDGRWQQTPSCVEKSCGKPEEVENGKAEDSEAEYEHGQSVSYKCSAGYELSGEGRARCQHGVWKDVPTCLYTACGAPPNIPNGKFRETPKDMYTNGQQVAYECLQGYSMGRQPKEITCRYTQWTDPPQCKVIGHSCHPPPAVLNGEIISSRKSSYRSGSVVTYACASLHKLEGNVDVTCTDGTWDEEPICREPCTVTEADMTRHHIKLKFTASQKIFAEHYDRILFECSPGYQISDQWQLRARCMNGWMNYPTCSK